MKKIKKKYRIEFSVIELDVPEIEGMDDNFMFEFRSEDYKSRQITTLDTLSLLCALYKEAILKGKTAGEIFTDKIIEK